MRRNIKYLRANKHYPNRRLVYYNRRELRERIEEKIKELKKIYLV